MSGDDDQLKIILDDLARLSGQPPPPQIPPDQLATGKSAISQLLALLGIASNGGDPDDTLDAATGHAERGAKTDDALTKFPANEEASAAKLAGVGGQDPMGQMVQQLPQLASGMAGALGGLFQPLAQIPQQVAQVGQQAMQAGMGALQHGAGGAAAAGEEIPAEFLGPPATPVSSPAPAPGAVQAAVAWAPPHRPRCSARSPRLPVLSPHRHIRLHPRQPMRRRRRPGPAARWVGCR